MNLDVTTLLDFQQEAVTNDKRFSELGLIDLAKDSTPYVDYISADTKQKMTEMSSARDAQIPVIKDQQVTVVSTPGFPFIPANQEESDQYAFTAYDVFSGFRHTPALYANNIVAEREALGIKMKNISFEMGNTIEGVISTVLESRKSQVLDFTTQVSQGDGVYTFNTGTDTLEVSKAAQKETMFNYMNALMKANKLGGQYALVTNPAGTAVQRSEMLKYANNNEKNLSALGFLPINRLHESHNISSGSDIFNGFFVRDGDIGLIENFPYDFRAKTKFAGQEWSVTGMEMPYTRMRANMYVNLQATNANALVTAPDSNLIMTHFQEVAIWHRFYVVYRYNSNIATRANAIVKVKGLTT